MSEEAQPAWSVNFLRLLQEAQQTHGLRAGDYLRYRQYCQRRLRRIFVRLNFLHGGKRYQKLQLIPEVVSDARHLHILLLQAERAWAHSEQLREENTGGEPRKQHHRLNKLRRAVKWSADLRELSKEFTDSASQAQAEAYAEQLAGLCLLAKEEWEPALHALTKSRDIWASQAAEEKDADMKDMFLLRIAQIEQNRRVCWYKTGRDVNDFRTLVEIGGGSNQAAISWRGKPVEIRSEKVRQYLSDANDQLSEISRLEQLDVIGGTTALNNTLEKYDRLFITYNDAIAIIRQNLRDETADAAVLHFSLNYLQYVLLENTIKRNLYLVRSYAARFAAKTKEKRLPGPTDIARLYDLLLQNIVDILAIPGVDDDTALASSHKEQSQLYRAARMYWKGEAFRTAKEYSKAVACYELGEQLAATCGKQRGGEELDALCHNLRKARCVAIGTAIREEVLQHEQVVDGTAAVSLDVKADVTLLEALDEFVERKQLVGLPPSFQLLTAKPMFFDVAGKCIDYPDEAVAEPAETTPAAVEETPKQSGGLFSRWWGR